MEELYDVLNHQEETIIIGGQSIYELFLPVVDRIYYTQIYKTFENGTTFFPNEWLAGFREVQREDHLTGIPSYSWLVYERKSE
jgi:dihydrofolate reductase